MFKSARIKLTLWYVLIITVISGMFSIAAYQNLDREITRGFRQRRIQMMLPIMPKIEEQLIAEVKQRIILELLFTNGIILLTAGGLSYFLAGKTLSPIEKMMEEQKRFTTDASHELRTPLTAMKTEIEVALREKKISLAETRKILLSNLEEVNKIQALTNYLLSLNRYQNNQTVFPTKELLLGEIIDKAINQVEAKAKDKKIIFVKNIPEIKYWGNEINLTELLLIFLDNAVKFSPTNSSVEIGVTAEIKQVVIEIKDKGIGIANNDLEHIFDRFYRADTSRSKIKTDGYGLGLAIAKNIVDLYKGKIEVESESGSGSAFRIILPVA